ncbi:hypothetical protein GTZ93_15385 [Corallococcus exiguus]|uniref:Uncharacterized protein n=1 Tax=Corallococcus exiguus TaxID=83462 RepID=A0A7X4Y951_9BACT|nr:hypothetical protein [Corallococcus exiguus]TNV54062.1 hypothetical protein FH620_33985 [Corallococcus exiguus]
MSSLRCARIARPLPLPLVERVLPHVPYRQWTPSFPHRVRWVLLKDVGATARCPRAGCVTFSARLPCAPSHGQ